MLLQRIRPAIALAFVASLSACIVPIQRPDEELFNYDTLAFIEIGKTTKDEIATAMSDLAMRKDEGEIKIELTPKKYRGGDWWLYAQQRRELGWFVFAGTGMGQIGDVDFRFLLIKFDPNGVVASYELSSSEGYECNQQGVCVFGPSYTFGSSYTLLASEDEDRVVKQFDVFPRRCGIYVYGKLRGYIGPVSIWIDGEQVNSLLNHEHFFFWQLDQGVHQLAAGGSSSEQITSIEFSCAAKDLYFFELKEKVGFFSSRQRVEIEHQDAQTGRKAVAKRQLTLNTAESLD